MQKYASEVDFVEILKSIRQLKIVTNLVLTEQQMMLSRFSKDSLVLSDSDSDLAKHRGDSYKGRENLSNQL